MNILVTGSSGFIGSALVPLLVEEGHSIVRLVRRQPSPGSHEVRWNPETGSIDADALTGIDAAVHLAGENLADKRWTPMQKARIRDSRVNGTRLLAETLARLEPRPKVLVSASAVGYYGDRGDEILIEDSRPGADFLAEATEAWEAAAQPAARAGIRVVNLRSAMTLYPTGGPLKRMLPPFRMGLGGKLGSGRQFMSWVSLQDSVRVFHHALITDSLEGPVNVTSPSAITNAEFTKALGRALSRPAPFTVPPFVLRIMFGEVADALLGSARMDPAKLLATGFVFQHIELESALREMLQKA
ncbi:MAG: TIGR01777 family protein [Chloroflexi bacterium]|nr:TIGR01777 family protein [Chloroflexota bacterium]